MASTLADMTPEHEPAGATIHIAGYRFTDLPDYRALREPLKARCEALGLLGTILLAPEGINVMLAGPRAAIEAIKATLREDPRLADLAFKESLTDTPPFGRLLVKLKQEIISFGVPGIDPARFTAPSISPAELRRWYDEGRDFVVLDTRNDYEVRLGTFENAIDPQIGGFREFPQAVRALPEELKQKPVVMFCTGGVRCEKASPFLLGEGYTEVYQLEGGILNYFAEVGGDHWIGECFVFDERVGLRPDLTPGGAVICPSCQSAVTAAEQASPDYRPGECCPHCRTPHAGA